MANNRIGEIKTRFGLLINYLVESGFSYELIEHKIIHNKCFLFFEDNNVEVFLSKPIENIIGEVFGKQVYIDYSKSIASDVFWAGQMYITLLANYYVPIQRSLLIYPLSKMIGLFNPYHEMNDDQLCQRYLEDEKTTSVLKKLIDKELIIKNLSFLIGIKEKTLLSYKDNERLFAMSLENATKLADFFEVPIQIFNKESNYSPDINVLLDDIQFKEAYIQILSEYLIVDKSLIILSKNELDKGEQKTLLDQGKIMITIHPDHLILIKKKNSSVKYIKFIKKKAMACLSKTAIKRFKESLPEGTLLF